MDKTRDGVDPMGGKCPFHRIVPPGSLPQSPPPQMLIGPIMQLIRPNEGGREEKYFKQALPVPLFAFALLCCFLMKSSEGGGQ